MNQYFQIITLHDSKVGFKAVSVSDVGVFSTIKFNYMMSDLSYGRCTVLSLLPYKFHPELCAYQKSRTHASTSSLCMHIFFSPGSGIMITMVDSIYKLLLFIMHVI
jgi:hypothetical protein